MQTNHKTVEELSVDCLREEGYAYIWIQAMDHVDLSPLEGSDLCWERLLEARIFSEDKELHLFWMEDTWHAVETIKESDDDCFQEAQFLRGKKYDTITLCHYIDYDEDGQAYITRSVIAGVGNER